MYRLDPDKNRTCTRRTVSVTWFFRAPKANVKMMDKKKITILSCFISLLSRPRNKMEILGIYVYWLESRPMFQIRLCINISDMGKRKKMLHYGIHYYNILFPSLIIEIRLIVLFCSDIKRTFRFKNVLLHDHTKR